MKLTHQNQIPVIKRSNFQMKFLLAASADVDHRLFYLHVFSMGLFFKLHNLLLAAVCHDISKKSSHLKTCNLVPVCHQLNAKKTNAAGITLIALVRNLFIFLMLFAATTTHEVKLCTGHY